MMTPKLWLYVGVALLWITSLFGVGVWQHSSGAESERLTWVEKNNKELADANALIVSLQADVTEKDRQHEINLSVVSKNYQEKLKNDEVEKSKFISGVRDGSIKLRQPAMPYNSSASTSSKTEPSSAGCNGQTGTELQGNVSEFLYSEAGRANEIVEQLTACQQIVIEDRKLCGK